MNGNFYTNLTNSVLSVANKDDVTLPSPSIVSSTSTNEDEDDLYSDDRHLWPSPMSPRSIRLVSSSPVVGEARETGRDGNQSIENTTTQLSDDAFETSSIYSNDSARTAVFVGSESKGTDSTPRTPVTARLREPLITPEEASPARPGLPFSYSCASFNSTSSDRFPLTHSPFQRNKGREQRPKIWCRVLLYNQGVDFAMKKPAKSRWWKANMTPRLRPHPPIFGMLTIIWNQIFSQLL